MKKLFTILACLMSGTLIIHAQGFSCTAGELSTQAIAKDPQLQIAKAQLDSFTREFIRQRHIQPAAQRSGAVYVIPVVFHILHDAGAENISDATVYQEMQHWNQYMSMTNPELPNTDAAFDTLIGNPQIEFRLAQKDPHGNCTNGIDRIYSQSTYYGNNNTKLNTWPRDQYLNVWVTKAIDKDVSQYGVLAFSMYPASVGTFYNTDIDGIICKYYEIGSNVSFSRPTLAHECGHWMNLKHTWGDTNSPEVSCGDDDVDDTPPTKGNQNTCINNLSVCNPPMIENEQNIMNYADCHFMFTKGQVDRMHAALNSPVSGRDSIWSYTNLVRTGTDLPVAYPNPNSCAIPVAEFAVDNRFVCPGQNITFTDVSSNAAITGRTWTFPADASITTSTAVSPLVSFSTPGWKQVTMQASNNNGSDQKTKTMVYVSDPTQITLAPYLETFNDQTSAQANWTVLNYDNDNTFWQWSNAGHYSSGSFKMNMYNANYDGGKDELVSPAYDLSNLSGNQLSLSFEYSFTTFDMAHLTDTLASLGVWGSIDCGNTWRRLYYKSGGPGLVQGIVTAGPYTPGGEDEFWKQVHVALPSSYAGNTAFFKFSLQSAKQANHFYLENVNIGNSTTGINDVRASVIDGMSIVPNPSSGKATIRLSATENSNITVSLYDMAGREINGLYSGPIDMGDKNIEFNSESLSMGVYMIKVSDGKSSMQKRFVKM